MERQRLEKAGPGRPRSVEAHRAILSATIGLIREVGYEALAMDAVAARAGVGKATVYRRWKSKEALTAAAIEQVMRGLEVPDSGTVEGDLQRLMRQFVQLYEEPQSAAMLSSLVAAMARSPQIAAAVRGGFLAARREAIHTVLARGVSRGELPRGVDLEAAMDLFSGALFYRRLVTGQALTPRFVRSVVETVVRGLQAAGGSRR